MENYFNNERAAKALGVSHNTIQKWLSAGILRGTQNGRGSGRTQSWKIEFQAIGDFIWEHYDLFDTDMIRDEALKKVVRSSPAGNAFSTKNASIILGILPNSVSKRVSAGKMRAYKIHKLWGIWEYRVYLDQSDFNRFVRRWFPEQMDDRAIDKVANLVTEAACSRDQKSVDCLNFLIRFAPEEVRKLLKRISRSPEVNRLIIEFKDTPQGAKLKELCEQSPVT